MLAPYLVQDQSKAIEIQKNNREDDFWIACQKQHLNVVFQELLDTDYGTAIHVYKPAMNNWHKPAMNNWSNVGTLPSVRSEQSH